MSRTNFLKDQEFFVRPAIKEDLNALVSLTIKAAEEISGFILSEQVTREGVRVALTDPSKRCRYFVADNRSKQIIGQVMACLEWDDRLNRELVWLRRLYVQSSSRRCGVATALCEHILAHPEFCEASAFLATSLHQCDLGKSTLRALQFRSISEVFCRGTLV